MKKYLSILSISLFTVLLFSCNSKSSEYTTRNITEETESIIISIDYPEFKNYKKLSAAVAQKIDENCAMYKTDSKEFFAERAEMLKEMPDEPVIKYDYQVTFEVTENDDYLSVLTYEYIYLGGAHPSYIISSNTIDKKTEEEVTLDKVTGKDYQQISDFCRSTLFEVLIENDPDQDEEDLKWLADYIKDGTPAAPEAYINFGVDKDKVNIIFNEYTVAPYVYGFQTVEMPLVK